LPEDIRQKVIGYQELSKADYQRWHKILAAKGWSVPHWPVEWGGTGWDMTQRYIYDEEFALAGAPRLPPFGPAMCAPVLLKFGTSAQKEQFLPRIREGDDFWVQGYSEPGAGSDLAAVKTRAERVGDHYVINGQKIWTTLGQHGDWIFCLVRTDPHAEKRQEGISFILIDMNTPGITVRPLILMDGGHEVNEIFFDNVKVPAQNLVFEENKGWTVAKYLLGHERMGSGSVGASRRELAALRALAKRELKNGKPLIEDFRFKDKISRVEIELDALEITSMRFLDQMRRTGQAPGADVSMLKIRGTEIQQMITELAMQAAGPHAQPFKSVDHGSIDDFISRLAPRYFNFRKASIYAGSNEIQRNIIAKISLGL
jgi:alkylation response protein AidB-like acyl-CoA dehydrogenase